MTTSNAVPLIADYVQFVAERHEKALEMLKASNSTMASVVQTDTDTNVKRCKCAFCRTSLQVGEGHPYNAFHGTRYLCGKCFPSYVAQTFVSVLELVKELE